jgi:hypothetical protein
MDGKILENVGRGSPVGKGEKGASREIWLKLLDSQTNAGQLSLQVP